MMEREATACVRFGRRERGSALLIVFVFAAIVAIMLYRELPVAAFEARREKEQLLIDRGHEYVRAIQLYYRKFKPQYPTSIDALEDTNRMRFLRHKYKDPFTGKDDWRLIHTNGLALTDSKVNPLKTGTNGQNQNGNQTGTQSGGTSNSSSGWFTKSDSGFGSDSSSGQSSSKDQPELIVPPVRRRPPAIRASGGAADNTDASSADNPEASPLSGNQDGGDLNAQLQASLQGEQNATGQNAQTNAQPGGAQQSGAQPAGSGSAPNPMQMVRNMLSSESPVQPQQMGSTAGAVQSGGIAGVASKAGGETIKVINDQTDYSMWEFVYDPTKDKSGSQPVTGGMQTQTGTGTSPSSTSSSSMGTQSSGSSIFGSNSAASPASGTAQMNPQ